MPTSGSRTELSRSVVQAPPWLARLLTPLIARHVAQEMLRKHPGLSREAIGEKLRADIPSGSDPSIHAMIDAIVARLPERAPVEAKAPSRVSALLLVIANLVPLYGVLAWGWDVFPLLVLFWAENVIVGLLNVARMVCAAPEDLVGWGAKLFLIPFFCVHYGMFTAGHGVFVLSGMFGGQGYKVSGFNPLDAAAQAFRDFGLWLPALVLFASHLFSFLWNYLGRGEFRRASLNGLMHKPYGRVIVLHLTIIFGGMAAMALGSPVWALVLLLALKTGVDVAAHLREHRDA